MNNEKKVIVDTDIGDDIDDLYALDYLAHCFEFETLGVTTVLRNARARAKMASYALSIFGRTDIPVYVGTDEPILCKVETLMKPAVLQADEYDEYGKPLPCQYMPEMNEAKVEEKNAVEFIGEQAKKYGKDLRIIAIGPLTNIALAIRTYGDEMKKIGGITLMGGNFYSPTLEWNIMADPEAAKIVFSSSIPVKAVGADVTMKCPLSEEREAEIQTSDEARKRLITKATAQWKARYHFSRPVMHDGLAVAVEVDESLVKFKKERVSVRLNGKDRVDRARTEIGEEGDLIACAYEVDVERFMELFCKRL